MDFIEKEPKFKKGEMVVFKDCDEDDIILYRAEKVVKVIWRKGQWFYKTEQNDMEFRELHFATRKEAKEIILTYLKRHFGDINN